MDKVFSVGINRYPGAPLSGCVNDIQDVATFLTARLGIPTLNVRLLADERASTAEVLDRCRWLVADLRAGDTIVFDYSGHGAQVATRNPQQEIDGKDEVICPVDFDWTDAHMIRDKQFHEIFRVIPPTVNFIWISDSCHSADLSRDFTPDPRDSSVGVATTLMQIPRSYPVPADIAWRNAAADTKGLRPFGLHPKPLGTVTPLNGVLISGCRSDQTSADAHINGRFNGALTRYLLNRLSATDGLSVPLTQVIHDINQQLAHDGYSQRPQLEGSEAAMKRPFGKKGS